MTRHSHVYKFNISQIHRSTHVRMPFANKKHISTSWRVPTTHLRVERMAQHLDQLLSILLRFAGLRCIQDRCFDATRQRPTEQFRCKFHRPVVCVSERRRSPADGTDAPAYKDDIRKTHNSHAAYLPQTRNSFLRSTCLAICLKLNLRRGLRADVVSRSFFHTWILCAASW